MELKDILYDNTYNKKTLLKRINDTIKAKNIVQRQMANDINIRPQHVNGFLKNRTPFSAEKIKLITDYLGM